MANHASADKANRQTKKRTKINDERRNRIRTFIRKLEKAIADNDKKSAQEAFKIAESEIMRGVNKGVTKLNSASRKISRLSKRVKQIAA